MIIKIRILETLITYHSLETDNLVINNQVASMGDINSKSDGGAVVNIQNASVNATKDDVLGTNSIQNIDESSGGATNDMTASMKAVSEETFDETNNSTKLSFSTAENGSASEKMFINSTGSRNYYRRFEG